MGNTSSSGVGTNLTSGFKQALDAKNNKLYQLIDFHGGGELVQWMKFAAKTGDYSIVDGVIEMKIGQYLYNNGKGKLVPIAELIKLRNKERNAMLGALRKKKGKGKTGPNILDEINQEEMQGDMMKALKFLDGGGGKGKGDSKYRELCWDLTQRGVMGETALHLCLLNGASVHNETAKRLVISFPKLVNDIFLAEEYYGQSPLHQAIVNEDPNMVRFLLMHGADVHQRCVGAFFCPDDQKTTRQDSMEHEWVLVNKQTNYKGRSYWGEYPLSFAACLGQEDCVRLLRARKADPNMRDTNGNTVLHMTAIHELPAMFDLCHQLGAKLHVTNGQDFTPLQLAAKLAKKDMFDHILEMEKDTLWTYGGVTCATYPLKYIDTIEERTGNMNKISALGLIVYGNTEQHLELLDGLMEDLLQEKWNAYAKKMLLKQFISYVLYFLIFFGAFLLRSRYPPSHWEYDHLDHNETTSAENFTNEVVSKSSPNPNPNPNSNAFTKFFKSYWTHERCFLLFPTSDLKSWARIVCELLTVVGCAIFTTSSAIDIKHVGWKTYLKLLSSFPAKLIFHLSFVLIALMVVCRLLCIAELENLIGIVAVVTTSLNFLFYCRALKFIGPFVLMVYKMIAGDMLRFFLIYIIFLLGFSQSFYIIFLHCESGNPDDRNVMGKPFESFCRLVIMSLGEFQVFYATLSKCKLAILGKILFLLFELLVSVMLINTLIAMMARTYEQIAETKKEWKRQWGQVILMLEHSMKPKDRLMAQLKYSRPIGVDKTKRAFVVQRLLRLEEKQEKVENRETKWRKFREERAKTVRPRYPPKPAAGANAAECYESASHHKQHE